MAETLYYYLIHLLVLALPLLYFLWQGLKLRFSDMDSNPETVGFKKVYALIGTLLLYLGFGWTFVILKQGWSSMVESQGGGW